MSTEQPRPGHATLAGGMIIGGSVVVMLSAWERISTLHTLEAQEALAKTLSSPPMSGLGLSVDDYASLLRILCVVGAGAAAAAAILGVQVFKRSGSARIVLTALSPLLLVGGIATAAFLAPMVVFGIALLWLQPTRDWYAGRPWLQRHEERRAARLADLRPPASPTIPPVAGPTAQPPADPSAAPNGAPSGAPTSVSVEAQPPAGRVFGQPMTPHHRADVVRRVRPQALVSACSLTWALTSLVLIGLALSAAILPSQADELLAEMARDEPKMMDAYNVTKTSLLVGLYLMIVFLAVWAVAALVLAVLAFRGQNWARITLVVSAVVAGLATLVMAIGAWPLLAVVAALGVSTWLLLRPEVGRWYQR